MSIVFDATTYRDLQTDDVAWKLLHSHTATKSRLGIIFDQITALSIDVGASDDLRHEALLKERDEIDQKLRELDEGLYEPIDDDAARERVRMIRESRSPESSRIISRL